MPSSRSKIVLNVADAEQSARRILPKVLMDYIEGGVDDETAVAENLRAFRDIVVRPRVGSGVVDPMITTTVLGIPLALPVILAPCGFVQLAHPDGAPGAARAAAAAGTISILSKTALCPPEEVARSSTGQHWFQINFAGGRETVKSLISRAAEAGYCGLVVTIDGPPPGNLERQIRNGLSLPIQIRPRFVMKMITQFVYRPRWTAKMVPAILRHVSQRASTVNRASEVLSSDDLHDGRVNWSDIEWVRAQWSGPLIVKGVLTSETASAARDAGADAVIVSNHGGRKLDCVAPALCALPEVVASVGSSVEVLVDGGVRRASDVIKALCLGARAVLIGRPYIYGLAIGGEAGVRHILDIFEVELMRTMTLIGCRDVAALDRSWVQPASPAMSPEPII